MAPPVSASVFGGPSGIGRARPARRGRLLRSFTRLTTGEPRVNTASDQQIRDIIAATRRIAVLGIKTEAQADQPAFYVA